MVWLADRGLIELFSTHFLAPFLVLLLGVVTHSTGLPVTMPLKLTGIGPSAASFSSGQPLPAGTPPALGFCHSLNPIGAFSWHPRLFYPFQTAAKSWDTECGSVTVCLHKHKFQSWPFLEGSAISISGIPRLQWWAGLSTVTCSCSCLWTQRWKEGRHLLPKLSPRLGLCELLGILMDLIPIYFLTCK